MANQFGIQGYESEESQVAAAQAPKQTPAEAAETIKNCYRQMIARSDARFECSCALDALNYATFDPPKSELTGAAQEALGCSRAEAGAVMNGFDTVKWGSRGTSNWCFAPEAAAHPDWAEVGRMVALWVKAGYPVEAQDASELVELVAP